MTIGNSDLDELEEHDRQDIGGYAEADSGDLVIRLPSYHTAGRESMFFRRVNPLQSTQTKKGMEDARIRYMA